LAVDAVFSASAYKSASGSDEEIIYSCIGSVVPDSCSHYSNSGESISHLPFSFKCHVIGSKGTISVVTYQSAEAVVKEKILRLATNHLLNFEALTQNHTLFISFHAVQTVDSYHNNGRKEQKNLSSSSSEENAQKFNLWEIMSKCQFASPVRKGFLQDLWKDSDYELVNNNQNKNNDFNQIILLEGVLGLNLLKCLEKNILNSKEINYNSHYSMEETQKLFQWICSLNDIYSGRLPSIRQNIQNVLTPLLLDRVFIYLTNKITWQMVDQTVETKKQNVPLTILLDLFNVTQLSNSFIILSTALFERKLLSVAETLKISSSSVNNSVENRSFSSPHQQQLITAQSSSDNLNSWKEKQSKLEQLMKIHLSDDLESCSMMELFLISYESKVIHELLQLFQFLCQNSLFSLSFFFPNRSVPASSLSLLSPTSLSPSTSAAAASFSFKGIQHDLLKNYLSQMFQRDSYLVEEVPSYFQGSDLLFHDLVSLASSSSFEFFSSSSLSSNEITRLKNFFENLLQLLTEGKASEEIMQTLQNEFLFVFLLPFIVNQKNSQRILTELLFYHQSIQDMKAFLSEQLLYGKYILIYFLLFIFSLMGNNMKNTRQEFKEQLAVYFSVDRRDIEILEVFRLIDSNPRTRSVEEDNQELDISVLCNFYSVEFLTKYNFLEPVVKKLLLMNYPKQSYQLLHCLLIQNHSFLHTKNGVLAFALSIPAKETWELHWQESRTLSERLSSSVDSLTTITEITGFMCKWCLRMKTDTFKPFGNFLNKDFNYAVKILNTHFLFVTSQLIFFLCSHYISFRKVKRSSNSC
jgi:hypothetical protein